MSSACYRHLHVVSATYVVTVTPTLASNIRQATTNRGQCKQNIYVAFTNTSVRPDVVLTSVQEGQHISVIGHVYMSTGAINRETYP